MPRARKGSARPVGLALAGGGPFGAIYEIGALRALEDSIEGLDLNRLDCYVGVSAGSFLAAALANGIPIAEVHRLFIEGEDGEGALAPELFMRPALAEFALRARRVLPLAARSAWRWLAHPRSRGRLESFAALGRAIPTGLFDNEAIHRYLEALFRAPGRTNDFRRLRRRLYLVATDLDTGESVSFGREGTRHVPISRAVQASAALPGLFPPVAIDGRHFVDGALRKTLHASEALDEGMRLVLCVNPIVPYDAALAARDGHGPRHALVDGGLPVVLSQTFRAVIHSRLATGIAKYRTQYRGSDVLLFEPEPGDGEVFFTNIFGYASRARLCEHSFQSTRRDLWRRRRRLAPLFARHGLELRLDRLLDQDRRAAATRAPRGLREVAVRLDGTLAALRRETL